MKKFIGFIIICIGVFLCLKYSKPYNTPERTQHIKECTSNVGKYVRIGKTEYRVLEYYPHDDTYLLDSRDKIKSHLINDCFYSR